MSFPAVTSKQVIKALDKILSDKEVGTFVVSGGEPTIQPGFFDMLEYLANTSVNVVLLTNSELFSQNHFLDRFKSCLGEKNAVSVITTIHSERPEEHEACNRTSGSFNRTLHGLDSLVTAGIAVTIKHCVTKINWKNLRSFYEFIDVHFPEHVDIQLCSIDYCSIDENRKEIEMVAFPEVSCSLEEMFDVYLQRVERGTKRNLYAINMPYCSCDPYYWKLLRQKIKNYSACASSNHSGGIHITQEPDNNIGTFGNACRNCLAEEVCPGTYRSAFEIYGDKIVRPITGN
jgi:MoaA/NifB/PqqE/SkfB family radical SAM enzyme